MATASLGHRKLRQGRAPSYRRLRRQRLSRHLRRRPLHHRLPPLSRLHRNSPIENERILDATDGCLLADNLVKELGLERRKLGGPRKAVLAIDNKSFPALLSSRSLVAFTVQKGCE